MNSTNTLSVLTYSQGVPESPKATALEAFSYVADGDQQTLLTCRQKHRLVPHGDHLTSKCREWMVRHEVEVGWCPEVA